MDLVQRVATAMTTAVDAEGVVVLYASGPESGRTVAHLHFHVVPCWADDQATFWPNDRSAHAPISAAHDRLNLALPPG